MRTGVLESIFWAINPSSANSNANPVILPSSLVEITGDYTISNLVFSDGNPGPQGAVIWLCGSGGAILNTTGNYVVQSTFTFNNINKVICMFWDGSYWIEAYRTNLNGSNGAQGAAGSGAPGAQGAQGAIGDNGAPSAVEGAQGSQGDMGAQGAQGANTLGAQGAQGDQGVMGAQGAQGAQGAP